MNITSALVVLYSLCIIGVFGSKKLIVVLVDGCRWDYINESGLKGIPRMIKNGVRAPFVYPVYPSLSYPNWYSIVTGLYPESHGFVNNNMYDPDLNAFFRMLPDPNSTDAHWWNDAEPIWVTAEKNGLKSGLYWWAGCEVEIKGVHPTICETHRYGPVNDGFSNDFLERIDDLVEMFKPSTDISTLNENSRISLALMYYGAVDYTGHYSGPDSAERKEAVSDIDEILDQMQTKFKNAGLENEVNIMVVSDHGMTDVRETTTTYIDLEQFAKNIKYQVSSGAVSMIVPEAGMLDKLFIEIKHSGIKGLHIFKKEDIPLTYHLKDNKKMAPLFLQVDKGFYIKPLSDDEKRIGGSGTYIGTHGYDPYLVEDMKTIFVATGPDFRKGFLTQELRNIDFYNIMCHILEIKGLPNNGTWNKVKSMLSHNASDPSSSACVSRKHGFFTIFATFFIVIAFLIN